MAKLLITLAVLCVLGAALVKADTKKEFIAKMMEIVDECKPKVGASQTDIEELLGKKPSSSQEGKCLRACIMEKCGVMDSNGKFVKSMALSHAKEFTEGDADKLKIANDMMDACSSIPVPDDHCEAAEQYGTCFTEKAIANGVIDKFDM